MARLWCFWLSKGRKDLPALTFTLAEVNGRPAFLVWDEGNLVVVLSLTISPAGIQEIYALLNPDKLAYLRTQLFNSTR